MKPARILAIDDEENFLHLLIHTLRKEGYDVIPASGGLRAMELLEKGRFDLVLVDIRMDPPDGVTVLEHIKKNFPSLRVIVMTSRPGGAETRQALRSGADLLLIKPVEIGELKAAVRRMLGLLDNAVGEA